MLIQFGLVAHALVITRERYAQSLLLLKPGAQHEINRIGMTPTSRTREVERTEMVAGSRPTGTCKPHRILLFILRPIGDL